MGINNARQFREAAEQRQIAQTFGRMAFSTIASAHSLRNYVGNVNGYMQLFTNAARTQLGTAAVHSA
ncbi:MAG: hypothetical protein M5U34_13845 [Chloroflexi bacterium]|nr:hypothetical protein [Chloroflexota bacterium]